MVKKCVILQKENAVSSCPWNCILCQKIVYSIQCFCPLALELSDKYDESWTFLAPSSNSSFEFLCKPVKNSNFYFDLESFRDTVCWPFIKFFSNYPVLFMCHLLHTCNCWHNSFQWIKVEACRVPKATLSFICLV